MKKGIINSLFAVFAMLFSACSEDIVMENTSANVFQSFWDNINERYVFMEEKNLNWDSIYTEYYPVFRGIANEDQMMEHFAEIIEYIDDGHVAIARTRKPDSVAFFWDFEPMVVRQKIYCRYPFHHFRNPPHTQLAQLGDSILYFCIKSIPTEFYDLGPILSSLEYYNYQRGIIVDLRDNIGGFSEGFKISSLFFKGEKTIYYEKMKKGKRRDQFTDFTPRKLKGKGIISDQTPIVLLCNSNTYSMGNYIAFILKDITNCTVVGEQSGGGGGGSITVPLPNGWLLSYTVVKSYNLSKQLMEGGLKPDIKVVLPDEFWEEEHAKTGKDPQLERAMDLLLRKG